MEIKQAVGLYRSILSISRVVLDTVQIQRALPATSTMGSTLPAAVEHRFMRFKVESGRSRLWSVHRKLCDHKASGMASIVITCTSMHCLLLVSGQSVTARQYLWWNGNNWKFDWCPSTFGNGDRTMVRLL